MIMENPFHINYPDHIDADLVKLAINGDRNALQQLVLRHQLFIYNLALKMCGSPQDAEDLVQEVFIKAITSLAQFKSKSSFRTWLYRITVNHFLNTRKRKAELQVSDFENYFNSIDNIPTYNLSSNEEVELHASIEEIRINCTAGMLLCLNREQRMVYILGEMFEINHKLGAEILDITPVNFRIRLMRARQDLYNWMNKRCGLVNTANPCRCARKTKGYIEAGIVDPVSLKFNTRYRKKYFEIAENAAAEVSDTIETLHKNIFRQHPLQETLTAKKIVAEIFNNNVIRTVLKL
jgi:RNA polymerase sigma factor (sigma-70 family)